MPKIKAFTIVELLVVACVFLVATIVLAPFVHMAKARAHNINCANKLRNISLGLHAYAADHDGGFPASLEALYPDYVESQNLFDCPASKTAGNPAAPDYEYVVSLTEQSPLKIVIAQDTGTNHRNGRNVLRVDGSLEWIAKR